MSSVSAPEGVRAAAASGKQGATPAVAAAAATETGAQAKIRRSVERLTQDLVREYLARAGYTNSLEAFALAFPAASPFSAVQSGKLEGIEGGADNRIVAMVDYIRRMSEGKRADKGGSAASAWSRDEVQALRLALKAHPASIPKSERFTLIAKAVGSRSRRECYDKAKDLRNRALQAKAARERAAAGSDASDGKATEPDGGGGGGRGHHKHRHKHGHKSKRDKGRSGATAGDAAAPAVAVHPDVLAAREKAARRAARSGKGLAASNDDALASLLGGGGGGGPRGDYGARAAAKPDDDGWGDMLSHAKTIAAGGLDDARAKPKRDREQPRRAQAASARDAPPRQPKQLGWGSPSAAQPRAGAGGRGSQRGRSTGSGPRRNARGEIVLEDAVSDAEEEADEGPRAMRGGGGGAGGAAGAGAYEDDGDAAGPGWGAGWSAASRTRTGGGADDNSLLSKLGGAALMVEEVGDVEVVGTQVKAAKAAKERVSVPGPEMLGLKGRQVNAQTAAQLRTLLFGDAVKMFNDAWKQQGFFFTDTKDLGYGLVQMEGGPCGVLAAVNAFVIKHLLYGDSTVKDGSSFTNPSKARQEQALVGALCDIVWRARDGGPAVVCLRGPRSCGRVAGYKPDKLTEKLVLYDIPSRDLLHKFFTSQLPLFQEQDGYGCALFTYSVMLTRGLKDCGADMDSAFGMVSKLIGQWNYAAQELVNLLLVGRAYSNVFDGVNTLEGEKDDKIVLHGIPRRAPIGFITLFEHYEHVKVGDNYHRPEVPVWVVCSESHYSVLFAERLGLESSKPTKPFDLYYYDELAKQDEVYRLTVDPDPTPALTEKEIKSEDTPPIDRCLRTRWPGSSVDWNGAEALL